MKRQRSKYDGAPRKWRFGTLHKTEVWEVESTSLARAVQLFRVGCLFPHSCSPGRISDGGWGVHYLTSAPDSKVSVSVLVERGEWKRVTSIPVVDDTAEYNRKALPANVQALTETGEVSNETALVPVDEQQLRPCDIPRDAMAKATVALEQRKAELQALVHETNMQVAAMREELNRRMKQVWLIELFLGSKEEVRVLRQGVPASASERVTVHQRVLCMDEELAVWHLFNAPEQVEEFCYESLDDFDTWLLSDPSHLDQVLPQPKGIVALRIRRNPKRRIQYDASSLGDLMAKLSEEEADRMTYLLVRNGENLYRLWVDVKLWPRFFPRTTEWDWLHEEGRTRWPSDEERARKEQQRYVGGLLVVQGLVQRSSLFDPIDKTADVFSPDLTEHFNCLRNDERLELGDGSVTWKMYREWLQVRLRPGVRVVWNGRESYDDKLCERTGVASLMVWPSSEEVYELDAQAERHPYGYVFSFLYLPDEDVWYGWNGSSKRKKRVRFDCAPHELWPVDFLSWRVARSLIENRAEREHYAESFPLLARWYRIKKAEQERERPFVDLVLRQAECDEEDRPRAERILRWWKVKTKTHRELGVDEAKALRMCVQALRRGDDPDDGGGLAEPIQREHREG